MFVSVAGGVVFSMCAGCACVVLCGCVMCVMFVLPLLCVGVSACYCCDGCCCAM